MFEKIISVFHDEEKRSEICIILSAAAVLISFFWGHNFPVDPGWIAIILCGIPIIIEAVIGLLTPFFIPAVGLFFIAPTSSILSRDTFAAAENVVIMPVWTLFWGRTVSQ